MPPGHGHKWKENDGWSILSPFVTAVVAHDAGAADGTPGPLPGELAVAARTLGA